MQKTASGMVGAISLTVSVVSPRSQNLDASPMTGFASSCFCGSTGAKAKLFGGSAMLDVTMVD
jgi:hypothetical protein